MKRIWQALGGTASALLFFLGRGARMTGVRLSSPPDFWFGTLCILAAGVIGLVVFIISRGTRLGPPASGRRGTGRSAVGWFYLVLAGMLLLSVASLFLVGGAADGPVGQIIRAILSTPDKDLKLITAVFVAGAGASALAGTPVSTILVRIAAIPLLLIWPLGVWAGCWAAWATLGSEWQNHRRTEVSSIA